MDNQKLAELLFPDVTKTPEYYEEKYPRTESDGIYSSGKSL